MKTGLVLEGGAMRGMYTAGVLDQFLEQGITFDYVVGVSAGALFGVNFLSNQPGRVIRYNKKYLGDKKYMGIRPLLKEGNLFSTEFCYDTVPRRLDPFDDETFQKSKVPFYAVITDVETGKPRYARIRSAFKQMDTLRASGSMPFVSKPVTIGDRKYLDGGISDSIPYRFLEHKGCDRIVVVLTRDASYRKKPVSSAGKTFFRYYGHRYPAIAERMLRRPEVYNRTVAEIVRREKEGSIFVIRPSEPVVIDRIEKDPEKLQTVYDLGRKDADKNSLLMKRLHAYLHA